MRGANGPWPTAASCRTTRPGGTVGGLLEGRWYGGHYGWSWPHGWYSVGQAAAAAALAAAAIGDDWFLGQLRSTMDEIIARGRSWPSPRPTPASGPNGPSSWTRTYTRRPCRCPTATATGAGSTTTRCSCRCQRRCGTTHPRPATASASSSSAPRAATTGAPCGPSAARKRPDTKNRGSPFSPGHPEYPERILAAAQAQVRHRLARMSATVATRWPRPTPPVAAVESGGHRGTGPAHLGCPAGHVQRGLQRARVRYYDAAADLPACRLRWRPWSPASIPMRPSSTWCTSTRRRRARDRAGRGIRRDTSHRAPHACEDPSWIGGLYDYGHRTPAETSAVTHVDGPWLPVALPRSTRIRLTSQLDPHTNRPSYLPHASHPKRMVMRHSTRSAIAARALRPARCRAMVATAPAQAASVTTIVVFFFLMTWHRATPAYPDFATLRAEQLARTLSSQTDVVATSPAAPTVRSVGVDERGLRAQLWQAMPGQTGGRVRARNR